MTSVLCFFLELDNILRKYSQQGMRNEKQRLIILISARDPSWKHNWIHLICYSKKFSEALGEVII